MGENPAALRAAVFSLSSKNLRGAFKRPPPSRARVNRAPLGYSAERAPLGGGRFCPPCLTPELIGAARRARRRSKALNEKIPMHIKNFL